MNTEKVKILIEPILEKLGYDLVRVLFIESPRSVLQIMAEPLEDRLMDVEDCAKISRAISVVLDVEDPIENAYCLEVSSPGIDRPLTRMKDFQTWKGFSVSIELQQAIEGRKRFSGTLVDTKGSDIMLRLDAKNQIQFDFSQVVKAKLVMTDELMNDHKN